MKNGRPLDVVGQWGQSAAVPLYDQSGCRIQTDTLRRKSSDCKLR